MDDAIVEENSESSTEKDFEFKEKGILQILEEEDNLKEEIK